MRLLCGLHLVYFPPSKLLLSSPCLANPGVAAERLVPGFKAVVHSILAGAPLHSISAIFTYMRAPVCLVPRFSDALRQAAIVCFEPSWQPNLTAIMAYAAAAPTPAGAPGGASTSAAASASAPASGAARCRRAVIQRHFAEAPAECRCMCDNCCTAAGGGGGAARDVSRHAAALLRVLRQQQVRGRAKEADGRRYAPVRSSYAQASDVEQVAPPLVASAAGHIPALLAMLRPAALLPLSLL